MADDPAPLDLARTPIGARITYSDERIRGLGMVHALIPLNADCPEGEVEIVAVGTLAEVDRLRALLGEVRLARCPTYHLLGEPFCAWCDRSLIHLDHRPDCLWPRIEALGLTTETEGAR